MCAYLIVLMMFSQIKAKMSADGSTRPGDRYVRWGIILPIALWVGVTGRLVISQTATTATSLSSTKCDSGYAMIVICNWWHILLVFFFSVTDWSCESSWNITFVQEGWLEYTAGGRAPALSLVVSLRTVLFLRWRYLSTNSFMAQETPSDVSWRLPRWIALQGQTWSCFCFYL